MKRTFLLGGIALAIATVALWASHSSANAPEQATVEYQVIPAAEFGIKNFPSGDGVFN